MRIVVCVRVSWVWRDGSPIWATTIQCRHQHQSQASPQRMADSTHQIGLLPTSIEPTPRLTPWAIAGLESCTFANISF